MGGLGGLLGLGCFCWGLWFWAGGVLSVLVVFWRRGWRRRWCCDGASLLTGRKEATMKVPEVGRFCHERGKRLLRYRGLQAWNGCKLTCHLRHAHVGVCICPCLLLLQEGGTQVRPWRQ